MKIDDATALRLYLQSQAGTPMGNRESNANEEARLAILDVPCEVKFGFSSRKNSGPVEIHACAWIFSSFGNDFFGAFYLPVADDSNVPSILNLTIANAIEQAKANPKFHAAKRQS